ncbi:MAG: LamG-like jellyroll fold domain-containing protein [Spirochaetota bacterium]
MDDDSLDFGTGNFTISLWAKYPSDLSGYKLLFAKSVVISVWVGVMGMVDYPSVGQVAMRVIEFDNTVESVDTSCGDNTWRHYVFLRNEAKLSLYIDGTLDREAGDVPTVGYVEKFGKRMYLKTGFYPRLPP